MINEIELTCEDGLVFLKQVENGSVDLILTDLKLTKTYK